MDAFFESLGEVAEGLGLFQARDPFLNSVLQWFSKMQNHAFKKWRGVAGAGFRCPVRAPHEGPCKRPPVGPCGFCEAPVCLEHSAVACNGPVVCVVCLNQLLVAHQKKRAREGAPAEPTSHSWYAPPPPPRQQAPGVGRGGFTWDDFFSGFGGAPGGGGPQPPPPPGPPPPDPAVVRQEHLKTLGLEEGATMEQIHKAFQRLAVKHHPDRQKTPGEKKKAEERFKRVNTAYQWLKAFHEQRAA